MELYRILSKVKRNSRNAGRPPAVIEIAPRGVLAASLQSRGQGPTYAFENLAADAVQPGIDHSNLRSRETVSEAVRSALEKVSAATRDVTVVLPDATTRLFILEFDTLPDNAEEAVAILRFRLRKVVPFEVESARVSYQMLPQQGTKCRVLAALIPGPILSEYEAAVHDAGYEPGTVLPRGLAELASISSDDPVLAASLSEVSLTMSITHGNDILLYRTHMLSKDQQERASELRQDVAVAAAYFEDNLSSKPQSVQFTGIGTAQEFARTIAEQTMQVVDMVPPSQVEYNELPKGTSIAGVNGALTGAR